MPDSERFHRDEDVVVPVIPRIDYTAIRSSRGLPDGENIVRQHHENQFDALNAGAAEAQKQEIGDIREQKTHAAKVCKGLRDTIENTHQWEPRNIDPETGKAADVPMRNWRFWDLCSVYLFSGIAVPLTGLAMATVFVNLRESGIPTFVDNWWIPLLFTAVVPAATFGIKAGYHIFSNDRARKLYAAVIAALAGVAFVAWLLFFATLFAGFKQFDWNAAADAGAPSGAAHLFVVAQLSLEVLLGSSFFIAIERVFFKYARGTYKLSQLWCEATEALPAQQAIYDALSKRMNRATKALAAFAPARAAYVNEAISLFQTQK